MGRRYYISSKKRAEEYGTDNVILGQQHDSDWVDACIENQYLYIFWATEQGATAYIQQHELEDCEVIEIE